MSNDNKPAAAQEAVAPERVAWASTGATGHKVVAMAGLHKLPYGDYDLFAAPVAAAPVDMDAHGLRALDTCIADLRRLLELAPDYDLDVMQLQSLETAIESMELRKGMSTPAAPGIDVPAPRNREEAMALAKLALAHLGVIEAHIDAAIARCVTDASPKGGSDGLPMIARSIAEWHEDDGPVTWWAWCGKQWAGEPAWIGSPTDSDWPGYHTHWTAHPSVPATNAMQATSAEVGE